MKKLFFAAITLFATCEFVDNPYDPESPNYVPPSFVIDTANTNIFDGDTLKEDALQIVLIGNDAINQFRFRLDSAQWSEWTGKGILKDTISITITDSGWHAIDMQTCYHPNADITGSSIVFYRHIKPSINAIIKDTIRVSANENELLTVNLHDSCITADTAKLTFHLLKSAFNGDSMSKSGHYQYFASYSDSGQYYARVFVEDGTNEKAFVISIQIANVNRAPHFGDSLPKNFYRLNAGDPLVICLSTTDADGDSVIAFLARTDLPHKADGQLLDSIYTWQSQSNDTGAYYLEFSATDGEDTTKFIVNVGIGNVNLPPAVNLISPANGEQAAPRYIRFAWSGKDDDNDDLTYTVYMGTLADQLEQVYHGADTTFSNSALIQNGERYFWKVVAHDGKLESQTITRSFTANRVPEVSITAPADNSSGVNIPAVLAWQGSDADQVDTPKLEFEIYLGVENGNLYKVRSGVKETSIKLDSLKFGTRYRWQVAVNDGKDTATGDLHSFTTMTPSKLLEALQVTGFPIAPNFAPSIKEYSVSIPYVSDSVSIIAIAQDSSAKVVVLNDTIAQSTAKIIRNIPVGESTTHIKVYARDNYDSSEYIINIVRNTPNTFQKYFGQSKNDHGEDIIHTKDSGFVIGGTLNNSPETGQLRLVKVNKQGDTEWSESFGHDCSASRVTDLTLSTEGNIIVLGQWVVADSVWHPHVWLLEYQQNMTRNWEKKYRCAGYDYEYTRGIVRADDGGYVIIARALSDSKPYDIWVFKTNAAGVIVKQRVFVGGAGHDDVNCIAKTPDGGYLIGGYKRPAYGDDSTWIFKVDRDCDSVWSRTYPDLGDGTIKGIACDENGNIFICGAMIESGSDVDAFIGKLSPAGEAVTFKKYAGEGDQNLVSLQWTSDGNFILAGWSGAPDGTDGWLVKANTDCDTLWSSTFGNAGNDMFNNAKETYDGGFLIAGYLYNAGMWIVKTDREGKLW